MTENSSATTNNRTTNNHNVVVGPTIGADISDPFLHITIDSSTDLQALLQRFNDQEEEEVSVQNSSSNRCKEVRMSIEGPIIPTLVVPSADTTSSRGNTDATTANNVEPQPQHHQHDQHQQRYSEFLSLLQTLLLSEPDIEKFLIDSGNVCESNCIPLQALGTILTHATALKRLDLSYIEVAVTRESELIEFSNILAQTTSLKSRDSLTHCCLDRSSVVAVLISEEDNNAMVEGGPDNQQTQRQPHSHHHQHRQTTLGLDLLLQALIQNFQNVEWLTICSDDCESLLTTATLKQFCQAPKLQELAMYNFHFQEEHLKAVFRGLSEYNPSGLVRLTIPGTLTESTANVIANYLCTRDSTLQGLTLTVNQFATKLEEDATSDSDNEDSGQPITTSALRTTRIPRASDAEDRSSPKNDKSVLDILKTIADGLGRNQSLQSFRLRGSTNISGQYKQVFANMLRRNYTLCYFSILKPRLIHIQRRNEESDDAAEELIQMYLKLNRHGRRELLQSENFNNKERWVNALAELKADLNCLFYLLSTSPLLCG